VLSYMQSAPFNVIITGRRYTCHVVGEIEGEAADAAEAILQQFRRRERLWPRQIRIECDDHDARTRLAAYFAAVPDLG